MKRSSITTDPQEGNDTPLCERSWGDDEPSIEMCNRCDVEICEDRVK